MRKHLLTGILVTCVSTTALAQGLAGLGPPGGLVATQEVLKFESGLLAALNRARKRNKLEPIVMDEELRKFARTQARLAARGQTTAKQAEASIVDGGHGGSAYRFFFVAGPKPKAAAKALRGQGGFDEALQGELHRAGVGAFQISKKPLEFQAFVLVVRDKDPQDSKPALGREQIDPVMEAANAKIGACYHEALDRNPNLRGTALMKLSIGGTGEVNDAKMLKPLGEDKFDDCALEVAYGLKFPAPYKGRTVTYNHPMTFSPPQGARQIGKLTEVQINSTFARSMPRFKKCFNEQRSDNKSVSGAITLALTVKATGYVGTVEVASDTIGDPRLAQCVLKHAKRLTFPRPKFDGEVDITYPLRFSTPAP